MPEIPQNRRSLRIVHPDSSGIDIGSREIFVAIPAEKSEETVRKFGVFTDELQSILSWLQGHGISHVAMESTGVYWIPLYDILSSGGIEVCLVNPRELKQVPGRKSDVKDCQWLQELHAFGLLRASFRPDDAACSIRSLVRQRQELVDSSSRQVQLMQKALTQMNVRLPEVVSDITGKTGMSIIRDIVAGVREGSALSRHRDPHCKRSIEDISRSLQGLWREEHVLSLRQALTVYDMYLSLIIEVEKAIKEAVIHRDGSGSQKHDDNDTHHKRRNNRSDYHNRIDEVWLKATGVDITKIEGIGDNTASIVLAEVGLNIQKFATPNHFTSWLGLAPAHDITGGRVIRRSTKRGNARVSKVLRLAAHAAGRTQTALGVTYRRLAARRGKAIAITAVARKLAVLIWTLLVKGDAYVRKSIEQAEAKFRLQRIKMVTKQAASLGLQVVVPQQPNFT
jgi:transposase